MHFAKIIPFWNSLDSVRRVHSDLELAALVFFALLVLFDVLAHLSDDKNRERRFERLGLWFFGIAVLAEIVAYPYGQRNDFLSAQVIGSLDAKAQNAADNASKALTDSRDAEAKSGDAVDKAREANDASSNALTLAHGAHTEAHALAGDIKSAKEQAADANARLAQTLKDVAAAEEELQRIKTPRSIISLPAFNLPLREFKGTTYAFLAVYGDQDSIDLLKEIDNALASDGWKRVNPPLSPPIGITIWPGSPQLGVSTLSGILIQAESTDPEAVKEAPNSAPRHVRAAMALKSGLASWVAPTPYELWEPLGVSPGNHTDVFITIGKKTDANNPTPNRPPK